jgi:hypothetical protein
MNDDEKRKLLRSVKKIELAPQKSVSLYATEIDRILEVIADVQGEPDMREALVTDESTVGDFLDSGAAAEERAQVRAKIEARLGVSTDGFLWEVAKRVREHARPH